MQLAQNVPKFIKSDPIRIRQVVINLISNGFKYTSKGGITLHANLLSNSSVKIAVKDTGLGIKKENLGQLFAEFSKIKEENDVLLNPNGVGLGLNISNSLAYYLSPLPKNGILVTSEWGKGSIFSFQVEDKFSCDMERELF